MQSKFMLKRKFIFSFIIFLIGSVAISAQENRLLVLGKIISAKDSLPIDNVVVTCKDPSRETHSDVNGHYAILLDRKVGQVLEVRILGHKTESIVITGNLLNKANGDTLHLDVVMK